LIGEKKNNKNEQKNDGLSSLNPSNHHRGAVSTQHSQQQRNSKSIAPILLPSPPPKPEKPEKNEWR